MQIYVYIYTQGLSNAGGMRGNCPGSSHVPKVDVPREFPKRRYKFFAKGEPTNKNFKSDLNSSFSNLTGLSNPPSASMSHAPPPPPPRKIQVTSSKILAIKILH